MNSNEVRGKWKLDQSILPYLYRKLPQPYVPLIREFRTEYNGAIKTALTWFVPFIGLIMLIQILFQPGLAKNTAYLYMYIGLFITTLLFPLGILGFESFRRMMKREVTMLGTILFIIFLFFITCGLAITDISFTKDFSTFFFCCMSFCFLWSLPYYVYVLTIAGNYVAAMVVCNLLKPGNLLVSDLIVMGVYSLMGLFVAAFLEYWRLRAEFLSINLFDLNEKLREASIRDPLTGLYNRRFVHEFLLKEIALVNRYKPPLSVVFIDIDHFKNVNDEFGHSVGDAVLKMVANTLSGNLRDSDVAVRYGGEEFLMVLPQTDKTKAMLVSERLRENISSKKVAEVPWLLTISSGVTEYAVGESVEVLMERVDKLLYQAKETGRNRSILG